MYSISACKTPRDQKLFERLPERLHGMDPAFIPPFPGSVVKYLSPKSAFNRVHGEIFPFLAWRDGQVVGRIAAVVNRTHNQRYGDKTGFFGFFDSEDDPALAAALFDKAAEVLRSHGLETMRGPYNPSINDECGLLVQGAEFPPALGLTWNPAYHQQLVEGCGFQTLYTLFGYLLDVERLEMPPRLQRIVEYVAKRSKLTLRPIKLDQLEKELEIVREVYNYSLERNSGFIPIAMDDLLAAADDMRAFADPELILIAEVNGERAGVALSLPDFNTVLARIKSTPHWLRLLHILWLMKTTKITHARQVVLGISPRFRDRGIHPWLLYRQFERAQQAYPIGILGWIENNNKEIIDDSLMMGAQQRQEWRIYERSL